MDTKIVDAADIFNDIFGWTTLLNIFAASIRTLTVLDIFIKNEGPFQLYSNTRSLLNISFHATVLLISWSGVIANVFLCDSILQKHVQILSLVCKLAATSESRFELVDYTGSTVRKNPAHRHEHHFIPPGPGPGSRTKKPGPRTTWTPGFQDQTRTNSFSLFLDTAALEDP
ncbi:hypothetical protein MTP99_009534 [Tenebrio molitor]|nr:hypothetical protein MTP99_009534 [Tenebrio molitor]